MLVRDVRRALADVADPEPAPGMQAYMKSQMPFLGIDAQALRKACKAVFDARPLADGHRRYRGYQRAGTLALYRHLVTTGAWWDLVDNVAGNRVGPILRSDPDVVAPVVRAWADDDDLWVRRSAILCQLGSKGATDVELLEFVLERNLEDSLHRREFFVRKAVGWALRQHARVGPDWVRGFVAAHEERLSGLSRREALKHLGAAGS